MTPRQAELARRREYEAARRVVEAHEAWMRARFDEMLREGWF
jgi:hypothetical protein